jgi:hypothetical protein
MTWHKFVGSHQEDLADGSILTPGQEVDLDADALGEERNKQLVDDGLLINIDDHKAAEPKQLEGDALEKRAQELDIKNRSKMSADELRAAVEGAEAKERGD